MQRGRPFLHKIRAPCAPYCAASPHSPPPGSQVRQLPMTYHGIVSQFPTIYHDFFFALPLGEMCMHFRVFRSASAPFSTHERGMHVHFGVSRRPTDTVLLHSPAPQYEAHFSGVFRSASAPFPLLSEECMCNLECRAGRRAERQGFFNRKKPHLKIHMHTERLK